MALGIHDRRKVAVTSDGRIEFVIPTKKRENMPSAPPPHLRPMSEFDPFEPAILHDCNTDKMLTWIGDHAVNYVEHAIVRADGTIEWGSFVFDGWGEVLGG